MAQEEFDPDAAFTNEDVITFKLGCKGEVLFLVPENRIRASSELVDAAMRGPWQEAQKRSISLPDFDKQTFGMYVHWLLTGIVHSKPSHAEGYDHSTTFRILDLYQEILGLAGLFDLGHYLLDTDFRDALSDILMQCTSEAQCVLAPFPPSCGLIIYRRIPDGSPTRRLVVDLATWTMEDYNIPILASRRDLIDPDYTMDLLLAVARRHVSETPGKSPLDGWETSCEYHCHGDKNLCYRKRADMSYIVATKRSAPNDVESPDAKRRA